MSAFGYFSSALLRSSSVVALRDASLYSARAFLYSAVIASNCARGEGFSWGLSWGPSCARAVAASAPTTAIQARIVNVLMSVAPGSWWDRSRQAYRGVVCRPGLLRDPVQRKHARNRAQPGNDPVGTKE